MGRSKIPINPELERSLELISRRKFIKRGLVIGAATALSGCATLMGKMDTRTRPGLSHLNESEYRVFYKLIAATLGEAEQYGAVTADQIPVMHNLDTIIGSLSSATRADVRLSLTLLDLSSVVLSFKFKTFTVLSDKDARKVVQRWENGMFLQRGAITSLKSLVYLAYWQDQKSWGPLDYDGPVSKKWKIKKLGNEPLPLA